MPSVLSMRSSVFRIFVVFVTDNASGKSRVLEWLGMRTLTEKIFFLTVTLAAYACDRIHAGWARPMVAMTVVATGCSKIMPVEQRGCMNAPPVLVKLIGWNLVCRHPLRIRVAFGAGSGDLSRIHRRAGLTNAADV